MNIYKKKNIKSRLSRYLRYLKRFLNYDKKKIYFPNDLGHPIFNDINNNSPLIYCNLSSKPNIYHYVSYIDVNKLNNNSSVDVIYEPVDDPLSILWYCDLGVRDSYSELKHIDLAKKLLLSKNLIDIFTWSNGARNQFKYFGSEEIMNKVSIIPMGLIAKYDLNKQKNIIEDKTKFLCIASDYYWKGVFLVLQAWEKVVSKFSNAELTLVCHNIPKNQKIPKNIRVIKDIPLSKKNKDTLYKKNDVFINSVLSDGSIGFEALSYGKPIIAFEHQHASTLLSNNNGFILDMPFNARDFKYRGKLWKNGNEFLKFIINKHNSNFFEKQILKLYELMSIYIENKNLIKIHEKNSIELFESSISINRRNQFLLKKYK